VLEDPIRLPEVRDKRHIHPKVFAHGPEHAIHAAVPDAVGQEVGDRF
jgi:hypothetical protein